ncbi:hypothetical protein EDD85DRAFT_849565 [Armillaria nabsnona]|nr:hypothetical protein EDD85DRAFT_849565 [Armillaria nabsnona]
MTYILQLYSWAFAVVLLLFSTLNGVSAVPLKDSLALTILRAVDYAVYETVRNRLIMPARACLLTKFCAPRRV